MQRRTPPYVFGFTLARVNGSHDGILPRRCFLRTRLRCALCGFGFRANRTGESEPAELYANLYMTLYQSELRGRLATARRHLAIVQRHCSPSSTSLLSNLALQKSLRGASSAAETAICSWGVSF